MPGSNPTSDEADLRSRLNLETGRIRWKEIEGFFARGMVMYVDAGLDLVEIAALTAENDTVTMKPLIEQGRVASLDIDRARDWQGRNPELWAVVVAPWVFVQEREVRRA